ERRDLRRVVDEQRGGRTVVRGEELLGARRDRLRPFVRAAAAKGNEHRAGDDDGGDADGERGGVIQLLPDSHGAPGVMAGAGEVPHRHFAAWRFRSRFAARSETVVRRFAKPRSGGRAGMTSSGAAHVSNSLAERPARLVVAFAALAV